MSKPEFKVGDHVKIWAGPHENFSCWVKSVRWDNGWRYETAYGEQPENNLVSIDDRRGWHYDSQGYCDNPGRGY